MTQDGFLPPTSGLSEVDAVLAHLGAVADRPLAEQATIYRHVQEVLQQALETPTDQSALPGSAR